MTEHHRSRLRRTRSTVLAVLLLLPFVAGMEGGGGCGPDLPPGVGAITVPDGVGFGGGTVYYPTTGAGPFPVVAVVPGYQARQSSIEWYGPLLAPEGYIVVTIDTNSIWDYPSSRGDQLLAALDYVTDLSAVSDIADPDRQGVMGWSMGGGGALEAATERPSLGASIPLAAWNDGASYPGASVPTLFVSCQLDGTAPNGQHSLAFYESMPASTEKMYLEIAGQGHSCVTSENDTIAQAVIAWMDAFLYDDASVPLCPPPAPGGPISDIRSSCPF